MTPLETLRTMTRDMRVALVRFAADQNLDFADADDLLLRGVVALDEYESLVLTAHGRRVVDLIPKGA